MATERELSHHSEFSIVCVENARDEICVASVNKTSVLAFLQCSEA